MIEKARNNFLGRGGAHYNCAQSIVKAYSDLFGLPKGAVEAHARTGGGNAPDGCCGALFAALYILDSRGIDKIRECKEFFLRHSGALTCKDIRSGNKVSCLSCVEKAAEFLHKTL